MSIEQTDIIDLIEFHDLSETVILTIVDHLDWEDTNKHLELLQEKLNNYLNYHDSGRLKTDYPEAEGKAVVVQLLAKAPLPAEGLSFFEQARKIVENLGVQLRFTLDDN